MSGYGHKRFVRPPKALTRVIPLLSLFAWFTALYALVHNVFLYPSAWFLYVYFLMVLIYRFLPGVYSHAIASLIVSIMMYLLGFNWGWYASLMSFPIGMYFARYPMRFRLSYCLIPAVLLLYVFWTPMALWGILPIFSWIVLFICKKLSSRYFSIMSPYTKYFYMAHCLILGIFGATWTLGGTPSFIPVFLSFIVSLIFSYLVRRLFQNVEIKI